MTTMNEATAIEVVREAIRTYGRTNPDDLWRQREAEFVVARLMDKGLLAVTIKIEAPGVVVAPTDDGNMVVREVEFRDWPKFDDA